jgi:hypothetical protein
MQAKYDLSAWRKDGDALPGPGFGNIFVNRFPDHRAYLATLPPR